MISKNLPLLMNLAYVGYNRGLDGDLKPVFDTEHNLRLSYCNQFVDFICRGFLYEKFEGMNANEMIVYMSTPGSGWTSCADENVAQSHANEGAIVIAGRADPAGHGHVCLVLPGILEKSASFAKAVPKVANVGKDVFFGKRVSFAFSFEEAPTYFVLGEMIS